MGLQTLIISTAGYLFLFLFVLVCVSQVLLVVMLLTDILLFMFYSTFCEPL